MFTVNIALMSRKKNRWVPLFGVVHAPVTKTTWFGGVIAPSERRGPDGAGLMMVNPSSPPPSMGTLASKEGTLLAATSSIKILVKGNGGHAAAPHHTIDPVVTGSKIVVELQTLISRELSPLESGVISITMANAGSATNVIPSTMELQGTIRSLTSIAGYKP